MNLLEFVEEYDRGVTCKDKNDSKAVTLQESLIPAQIVDFPIVGEMVSSLQ